MYNIYKNLNNKEYKLLKNQISNIKPFFDKYLNRAKFKFNPKLQNEYLGLDYKFKQKNIFGNIGFSFLDLDKSSFNFYISKSLIKDNDRYFKSILLCEEADLYIIEANIAELLNESIILFQNLKESELELQF